MGNKKTFMAMKMHANFCKNFKIIKDFIKLKNTREHNTLKEPFVNPFDDSIYTNYRDEAECLESNREPKILKKDKIINLVPSLENLNRIFRFNNSNYSWLTKSHSDDIIDLIDRIRDTVSNRTINVLNQYITGYKDHIDRTKLKILVESSKPEYTLVNTHIQGYIDKEMELKRLIKIPKFGPGVSLSKWKYLSSKIICINEIKERIIDDKIEQYEKQRYVYNNVVANQVIKTKPHVMPTLETLIVNTGWYNFMINSIRASILDRTDYYRQWYTHPDNYRIQIINTININKSKIDTTRPREKKVMNCYIDLAGRMGASSSSYVAQNLSDAIDEIFNSGRSFSRALTLQDDSLIMFKKKDQTKEYLNISDTIRLKINQMKSQIYCEVVTWAGYKLNLQMKSICLKSKRIDSMVKSYESIINAGAQKVSRRTICQFLGKVYSARIILWAQRLNLSPILILLRQNCFLYQKFYDNTEGSFYDELVDINPNVKFEMKLCISICSETVKMADARNGFMIKETRENVNFTNQEIVYIYSDATLQRFGFWINLLNKDYAYSGIWDDVKGLKRDSWAINDLEMLSALISELFAISILKSERVLEKEYLIIVFVDNLCARSILTTYRTNCKSKNLARMSKLQMAIDITFKPVFKFKYIKSQDNKAADWLSRSSTALLSDNDLVNLDILKLIGFQHL